MPRHRFTPAEITSFIGALERGAKVADVAQEHGFSPSTFRRWRRRYGFVVVPYVPSQDDLQQASGWRNEPTAAAAWRTYRAFASDPRWEADSELPVFDQDDSTDQWERLILRTRPDARVVLICEKMSVLEAAEAWKGARPSVAHATAAALAWVPPLPSRWTTRVLLEHARRLKAPLLYLGDLDPQALHTFAALRAGGREGLKEGRTGAPVRWVGLDSRWLDFASASLGVSEVPRSWMIKLKWLDQEYWHLMKRVVPEVRRIWGARACALLDRGVKIEADGLVVQLREPFLKELGRRLRRAGAQA